MTLPGFTSTTFYLSGGLIIWAVRFHAAYVVTGVLCARPSWHATTFGIDTIALLIVILTALALAADGVLLRHALGRLSAGPAAGTENRRFVHYVAAVTAGLGGLAMVWETIPAFTIPICA